jgi:hypothetical protein
MDRINLFFLLPTNLPTEKNYRRKIHRRSISVGKLITDGICVLHRRKNSVGKTVKSCSGFSNLVSAVCCSPYPPLLLPKSSVFLG